jgi:hypothetical protein
MGSRGLLAAGLVPKKLLMKRLLPVRVPSNHTQPYLKLLRQ